MLRKIQSLAALTVLYNQQPNGNSEPFIEVRRWETPDGDWEELVLEVGHVDEKGDLATTSEILPYHYELVDVFAHLNAEGINYVLP